MSVGRIGLGDDAEHRAGVEALPRCRKVGGAGDLVAGRMACCTGAAPRQAGSSEKCRLTQPCRGMSSAGRGSSAP